MELKEKQIKNEGLKGYDEAIEGSSYQRLKDFVKRFDIPGKLEDGILTVKEMTQLVNEYKDFAIEYKVRTGKDFDIISFMESSEKLPEHRLKQLSYELGIPDEQTLLTLMIEVKEGVFITGNEMVKNYIKKLSPLAIEKDSKKNGTKQNTKEKLSAIDPGYKKS